jgi:hypothetical protein
LGTSSRQTCSADAAPRPKVCPGQAPWPKASWGVASAVSPWTWAGRAPTSNAASHVLPGMESASTHSAATHASPSMQVPQSPPQPSSPQLFWSHEGSQSQAVAQAPAAALAQVWSHSTLQQ